jgi:hypothetical protein
MTKQLLTSEYIEQIIKNNGLTLLNINKINGYSFYSSKGNEVGNNLIGLKDGSKYIYVPIIYSEGREGYDNQLNRLKEKASNE